jgi:hypothetical protein
VLDDKTAGRSTSIPVPLAHGRPDRLERVAGAFHFSNADPLQPGLIVGNPGKDAFRGFLPVTGGEKFSVGCGDSFHQAWLMAEQIRNQIALSEPGAQIGEPHFGRAQ